MKIKTRFALGNSVMVLLSLVILLAISSLIINTFERNYYKPDNMLIDENSDNVKNTLETTANLTDYKTLADKVAVYGYSLYVIQNGKTIFSNGEDDNKVMHILMAPDWKENKSKSMVMDGATIVGVKSGSKTFVAVKGALKNGRKDFNKNTSIQNFLIEFIIIGIIAIAFILLVTQIYSRLLIKHFMKPVNTLNDASQRIKNGDYTQSIVYYGDDEFKPVVKSFNQMQQHLLHEKEKSASYEKARTDMIAGISHDLRTPLTSVKGYIKGVSDGVAATPEKQKQYLDIAYRKSCDMEQLLNKLFYFSKLETGNMPINLHKYNLAEFAKQFVSDANEELAPKNIEFNFECENTLNHTVMLDAEQMNRVLTNFVDNSIKYADVDSLKLNIKVWSDNNFEHLVFSDNGQGVPENMLNSIFECFFRVDEARGFNKGEGSGLGLHIAKYITEAHNGAIKAYNNNGLAIEIILPRVKENENEQNTDS